MYRIVYAGTPEFAVPALSALAQSDHDVVAVYTQPDRPAGRGRKLQPGPVKRCAEAQGIPVFQPQNLGQQHDIEALASLQPDLMVVAAYGLILPQSVLDIPRFGCVNIHASVLPRWRGASPIQQSILSGDPQSGVSLMKMEAGLDTGPVIATQKVDIDSTWNASDLHDVLAPLGAELLMDNLSQLEIVMQAAKPQNDAESCYAPLIRKSDAEIDWGKTAEQLLREIRAFNAWPVSYTFLQGENLRIWSAEATDRSATAKPGSVETHDASGLYVNCGDQIIRVNELQFAGRRRCSAAEACNARNLSQLQLGQA
ncbi:MAG: methionyl-tRNA formyltransferase [Pseudomonadota bacterium]